MNKYILLATLFLSCILPSHLIAQDETNDVIPSDESKDEIPLVTYIDEKGEEKSYSNLSGKKTNSAHIRIWKHSNYRGPQLLLWLNHGARINLSKCKTLNNNTSSIMLNAPIGTSITVFDQRRSHRMRPTYSGTWWGQGMGIKQWLNVGKLKYLRVHDNITDIEFKVDGRLANEKVQMPKC